MLHGFEMYLDAGLTPAESWELIILVFLVVLVVCYLVPMTWIRWREERRYQKWLKEAPWRIRL
jgi:heme/copper-type cytochrome/quinol oxidase subunit 4